MDSDVMPIVHAGVPQRPAILSKCARCLAAGAFLLFRDHANAAVPFQIGLFQVLDSCFMAMLTHRLFEIVGSDMGAPHSFVVDVSVFCEHGFLSLQKLAKTMRSERDGGKCPMHSHQYKACGYRREEVGASVYRTPSDGAVNDPEHHVQRRMFAHESLVADPDQNHGDQKHYECAKRRSADSQIVCADRKAQQPINVIPYFVHSFSKPRTGA